MNLSGYFFGRGCWHCALSSGPSSTFPSATRRGWSCSGCVVSSSTSCMFSSSTRSCWSRSGCAASSSTSCTFSSSTLSCWGGVLWSSSSCRLTVADANLFLFCRKDAGSSDLFLGMLSSEKIQSILDILKTQLSKQIMFMISLVLRFLVSKYCLIMARENLVHRPKFYLMVSRMVQIGLRSREAGRLGKSFVSLLEIATWKRKPLL